MGRKADGGGLLGEEVSDLVEDIVELGEVRADSRSTHSVTFAMLVCDGRSAAAMQPIHASTTCIRLAKFAADLGYRAN